MSARNRRRPRLPRYASVILSALLTIASLVLILGALRVAGVPVSIPGVILLGIVLVLLRAWMARRRRRGNS